MSDRQIEDRIDGAADVPVQGVASRTPPPSPDYDLMARLTAIMAAPLPSLIIGDPRAQADMLQAQIVDLKLAACVRLRAMVDAIPVRGKR